MSGRAEFVCPSCRSTVAAPASLAGSSAPCPKCGAHVGNWPAPTRAAPASLHPLPPPLPGSSPADGRDEPVAEGRTRPVAVVLWCGLGLFLLVGFVGVPLAVYASRRTTDAPPATATTGDDRRARRVTGTVDVVSYDMDTALGKRTDGQGYIVLVLNGERNTSVICRFPPGTPYSDFENFRTGDAVTVRGVVESEGAATLRLTDCELVSSRPRRR